MSNPIVTNSLKLQMPTEVIGSDLDGLQFFEHTTTLTVLRDGVTIQMANKLAPESEVILRNPKTNEEALALMVGQMRDENNSYIYSFAFLDPSINLWRVQFPSPGPARKVRLECGICHSVCAHPILDIEMEILEAGRKLTRVCAVCEASTIWNRTGRPISEKISQIPPAQDPPNEPIRPSVEERRKNKRTLMNTTACLRHSGMEDIVTCEDVSRGGFRFTDSKRFPEGTRMDVAVPYLKSSSYIFTPSYITYCQEMPGGIYRHGVTYLKKSGSIGWDP